MPLTVHMLKTEPVDAPQFYFGSYLERTIVDRVEETMSERRDKSKIMSRSRYPCGLGQVSHGTS